MSSYYETPLNIELAGIDINRFSGLPTSGVLSGSAGGIFFSPSLFHAIPGNEIEISEIKATATASDQYMRPQGSLNRRVFTWGPNSNSRTNTSKWVTIPKYYTVIATMVQTSPPLTTVYKIP